MLKKIREWTDFEKLKTFIRSLRYRSKTILFFAQTLICIVCIIALIVVYTKNLPVCITPYLTASALGSFTKAAVATDGNPCAEMGNQIMYAHGGNVIDATVTAQLCNGLVHMQAMGLGGGFLLVYFDAKSNRTYTLDARETAPNSGLQSADLHQNDKNKAFTFSNRAVAIPGEMHGLIELHRRFGHLSWKAVLQPVIDFALQGVPVQYSLAATIKNKPFFKDKWNQSYVHELRELLTSKEDGREYQQGDRINTTRIAKMLEMIANDPSSINSTREGSWNHIIHQDMQEYEIPIELQELADYRPVWRDPLLVPIQTYNRNGQIEYFTLHTMRPPASGALVAFGLNVMSNFKYRDESVLTSCLHASRFFHRLVETMKIIMQRRTLLCDESFDFEKNRTTRLIEKMTSPEYAKEWSQKIQSDSTQDSSLYYADMEFSSDLTRKALFPIPEKSGTSHSTLIDPQGNAVSVTSTINTPMGSLRLGKRSGILFNNEMDDFSLKAKENIYNLMADPANYIQPGKRPLSSMSPVIVTDNRDRVKLVAGASGGSRIVTGLLQFMALKLHLKLDVKQAIDMRRLHHQWMPDELHVEENFPEEVKERLLEYGHEFSVKTSMTSSVVQAIEVLDEAFKIETNADARKGGNTAGF